MKNVLSPHECSWYANTMWTSTESAVSVSHYKLIETFSRFYLDFENSFEISQKNFKEFMQISQEGRRKKTFFISQKKFSLFVLSFLETFSQLFLECTSSSQKNIEKTFFLLLFGPNQRRKISMKNYLNCRIFISVEYRQQHSTICGDFSLAVCEIA